MTNLLKIFRSYLHQQKVSFKTEVYYLKEIKNYFSWKRKNILDCPLSDINEISLLQSIFNERRLSQYQAGAGLNRQGSVALFELGKFLVGQSFLAENPAEKVWKIPAEQAKVENCVLREFTEDEELRDFRYLGSLGKVFGFKPAFAFLIFVLFFSFSFFSNYWRGLPTSPTSPSATRDSLGVGKSAKTIHLPGVALRHLEGVNNFFRLELAKKVYAESNNKDLGLIINLNHEEKIVSSSANRVTR